MPAVWRPSHHDGHFVFHWYVIEHPHPRRRPLPYQARIPVAALDVMRIVGLYALHRVFERIDGIPATTADDTHGSRSCMRDAASSSARRGGGSRATADKNSAIARNAR